MLLWLFEYPEQPRRPIRSKKVLNGERVQGKTQVSKHLIFDNHFTTEMLNDQK